MKKLNAGLIALTIASVAITPAVSHAATQGDDSQSVCLVDGQASDYKKAYYPEFDQTVESIATGPFTYHKYEDGVYSRNHFAEPREVRYYTPEVFSDWVLGIEFDATVDRFNNYGRVKAIVDGAIADCLANPTTNPSANFTPVELEPTRPEQLPDASDVEPDSDTQQPPATDNEGSSGGAVLGILGLSVVAAIAAIIAAVSGVLPFPF